MQFTFLLLSYIITEFLNVLTHVANGFQHRKLVLIEH